MKSSKRGTSPKYFLGLAVSLVFLFTVFSQSGYKMLVVDEDKVLGTSSATTTAKKNFNGVTYLCKKTNCDSVSKISSFDQNVLVKSQGDLCKSVKDRDGKSVCYWNTDYFTTHQCNVDKSVYRNKDYKNNLSTVGGLNQALSGTSENIVYYDCTTVTPTLRPTKTPTRRQVSTPTPKLTKTPVGGVSGSKLNDPKPPKTTKTTKTNSTAR